MLLAIIQTTLFTLPRLVRGCEAESSALPKRFVFRSQRFTPLRPREHLITVIRRSDVGPINAIAVGVI